MAFGRYRRLHGLCLTKLSRYVEAEQLRLTSYEGLNSELGAQHPDATVATSHLIDLYKTWHAAEPGKGYDAKATKWKSKLDAADQSAAEEPAGGDS